MSTPTTPKAHETTAEKDAREARDVAAVEADAKAKADAHDAKVADERRHESPEARRKREAAEQAERDKADQLSRIDEARVQLTRALDTYESSVASIITRLGTLSHSSHGDVAKAAKQLADEFDLDLKPKKK